MKNALTLLFNPLRARHFPRTIPCAARLFANFADFNVVGTPIYNEATYLSFGVNNLQGL